MMKSTMQAYSADTMSHTASARTAEAAFCCAHPAANCIAVILDAIPMASIIISLAILCGQLIPVILAVLAVLVVLGTSECLRMRTRTIL